ncbi:uncharacterized protein LOC103316018 [Nasonia vitripennis]|uniref:Uncharacterized protein n=1 Tax=Nasonia vitripennis TaxID=7425 RepID=A0A7M7H4F2_NASVI|nr:uncharacterized protein LOC103316018 [Nasonia vitripennis]
MGYVFLAQVYREESNTYKVRRMYERVLRDNPQSDAILLRIALGFMTLRDFQKPKFCLDKAAKNSSEKSMFLHYQGLYHFKQQQYREASQFFKETTKLENLPAEYNYMIAILKIDRLFDVMHQLLQMFDKYKNWPKDSLQKILLELAFVYFKKDRNLEESLKYFLEAIEINSDAKSLEDFSSCHCYNREKNIFKILSSDALPLVLRQTKKFNKRTCERAEQLKDYCYKYMAEFEEINHAFGRLRF